MFILQAVYKGQDIPPAPPEYRNRDVNGKHLNFINGIDYVFHSVPEYNFEVLLYAEKAYIVVGGMK